MIQRQYGGSVVFKERNVKFHCHTLRIIGKENMKRFLLAIYPYAVEKKEQIELALKFIETIREENLGCVPLSEETHTSRGDIHSKLKLLKM
jgi:hypothetical protein